MRVWQRISDARALYISARPEGGSWRTLGTIPIDMSGISGSRAYRYGDITVTVPRAGTSAAVVEVRVWQRVRDDLSLYISARPRGGSWGTLGTIPLDMSGRSSTGTFRYGDITVRVPLPAAAPTPTPSPAPSTRGGDDETCDFADSAQKVVASTVLVRTATSEGSAFYVGNGEFVTAGHVIDDASTATLTNERINTTARVVGYFPFDRGDMAILRATGVSLTPLEWAGRLGIGETVAFSGYPLGSDFGTTAAISRGIVSRLFNAGDVSWIQTDAQINPGNSGGPLFDECGRVAGVASWKVTQDSEGDATEGLGFAVAEPSLNRLLSNIRAGTGEAPDSTSGSRASYEDVDALIDAVVGRWNATNDALDGLVAQWNNIINREERPSNRLAENARSSRGLAQEMVEYIASLRRESAARETAVRRWLDEALSYWSAGVTQAETEENYALDVVAWSAVLYADATQDDAFFTYKQDECELWKIFYSNWEEVCDEVSDAEQTAADSRAEAEAQDEWEHIDALHADVSGRWNEAREVNAGLTDQWNATVNSVYRPSQRLARIAQRQSANNRAMVSFLRTLSNDPALTDATVERWWRTVIAYWESNLDSSEASEAYALDRVEWDAVERADAAADLAFAAYQRAECDLWRLQEYTNADELCAEAGR